MCLSWKHYHLPFLFRGDDCVVLCMLINAWLYYSIQIFLFLLYTIVLFVLMVLINSMTRIFYPLCVNHWQNTFIFVEIHRVYFHNTCSKCCIIMGNISSARMSKINVHYIFIALFCYFKGNFLTSPIYLFSTKKIKFVYVLV